MTVVVGLASVLALGALGCSGSSTSHRPVPLPGPSEMFLTVSIPAGAVYGFELEVLYDAALVTPATPLADAAEGVGIADDALCTPFQVHSTVMLSCASASALDGPGAVADFLFEYEGAAPVVGDFDVTCEFFGQDGSPVMLDCTSTVFLN